MICIPLRQQMQSGAGHRCPWLLAKPSGCSEGVHPKALTPAFPQVLKSTGDVAGGRALYEGYAAVTDAPPECFLSLRDTVLLRKEARKLIVQPNTRLEGNGLLGPLQVMEDPPGAHRRSGTDLELGKGYPRWLLSPHLPPSPVLPLPNLRPTPSHPPPPSTPPHRVRLLERWQEKVEGSPQNRS